MMAAIAPADAALFTLSAKLQLPRSIKAILPASDPAARAVQPRLPPASTKGSAISAVLNRVVAPSPTTLSMLVRPAPTGDGPVTVAITTVAWEFVVVATVIA